MHCIFFVVFISTIYVQAISTSDALFINDEHSNELNNDLLFNENNPNTFSNDDDDDDDDINTSFLTTDLFPSKTLPDLDDTTTFLLANNNNNNNNPLENDCDSSSSYPPIKARSSGDSDTCQQNTANLEINSPLFEKEDTIQETQEEVERWWCSGNREQDRGKLPVCAFTYENKDVEIMLDGFALTPSTWEDCQFGRAFCCATFWPDASLEIPPNAVNVFQPIGTGYFCYRTFRLNSMFPMGIPQIPNMPPGL